MQTVLILAVVAVLVVGYIKRDTVLPLLTSLKDSVVSVFKKKD